MLPSALTEQHFAGYPPEAQLFCNSSVALFRKLPLSFLSLFLREAIAYDWKFPPERRTLEQQVSYLRELPPEGLALAMAGFKQILLDRSLELTDWINQPAEFSERLSAHLWTTHQVEAFRVAAVDFMNRVNQAVPLPPQTGSRLVLVAVGQGAGAPQRPLFGKLKPHGVYFNNVDPSGAATAISRALERQARENRPPYAHWYVDGGPLQIHPPSAFTQVSYEALAPVREQLKDMMRREMHIGGRGPEALRSRLASLRPADVGLKDTAKAEPLLNHFQLSLLTEGSGTQLFSTTFVQWAAREILRRAEPETLFTRYGARRREQSMDEIISGVEDERELDPNGSLVDAEMGAYYTWINLQRLPNASNAKFLVWFENGREAFASGPDLPQGARLSKTMSMDELLQFAKITS